MRFFSSTLVVASLAVSALAVAHSSVSGHVHARRCSRRASISAVASPASSSAAASSAQPVASSSAIHTSSSHSAPAATSTSPAAATPTVASDSTIGSESFLSGTQTGQGTYYGTGLGACGITNTDTDYIAAVSKLLFDTYPGYAGVNPNNNPVCGKKIKANYQGKSVTITVTDRCEACKITDLDFSPTAFSQIADQSIGRISGMTWNWV